jgi:hypothetical protein
MFHLYLIKLLLQINHNMFFFYKDGQVAGFYDDIKKAREQLVAIVKDGTEGNFTIVEGQMNQMLGDIPEPIISYKCGKPKESSKESQSKKTDKSDKSEEKSDEKSEEKEQEPEKEDGSEQEEETRKKSSKKDKSSSKKSRSSSKKSKKSDSDSE